MDEIRCKRSILDHVPEKCVWRGKLDWSPRIGEYLIIHEGWALDPVIEVHYNVFNASVLIYIKPDLFNEYPEVE